MPHLGVNIDHVATIRQARNTNEPDPVWAAALSELGGADCITLHLREDRRHIQDRDLEVMRQTVKVKLNLELAAEADVVSIACRVKPDQVTLVPERREEVTTEGGLDVVSHEASIVRAIDQFREAGISVSLFLDPEPKQIDMAAKLNVDAVELHTGQYALTSGHQQQKELTRLSIAGEQIHKAGMQLLAGHGLTYTNVQPIAQIPEMAELNIGHSIVSRAVFVGFRDAVAEMKRLITL